jgi:hypothetical protein
MRRFVPLVFLLVPIAIASVSEARIGCGKRAGVKVDGRVVSAVGAWSGVPSRQLSPETIQSVVRASFGKFRSCYENGLRNCPNLNGRVRVDFVIQPDGTVSRAILNEKDTDLPDTGIGKCVAAKFRDLRFPGFDGPPMRVSYPVSFTPGG